jgi:hypothetical protein
LEGNGEGRGGYFSGGGQKNVYDRPMSQVYAVENAQGNRWAGAGKRVMVVGSE